MAQYCIKLTSRDSLAIHESSDCSHRWPLLKPRCHTGKSPNIAGKAGFLGTSTAASFDHASLSLADATISRANSLHARHLLVQKAAIYVDFRRDCRHLHSMAVDGESRVMAANFRAMLLHPFPCSQNDVVEIRMHWLPVQFCDGAR